MKRLCMLLILLVSSGCSLFYNTSEYDSYITEVDVYSDPSFVDFTNELSQRRVAFSETHTNNTELFLLWYFFTYSFEYSPDLEIDSWDTPEETWAVRTGDCEDLAILFMAFAVKYKYSSPDSVFLVGAEVSEGKGHAFLYFSEQNLVYSWGSTSSSLTSGGFEIIENLSIKILSQHSYSETMYQAFNKVRLL